ncbi:MAG: ribonucleoside-diphosphate reductase subunit alpha [Proteobacteria bacterium]|nr:ribonucleoside-diphosphate reductase subunit alpha [Pseudomonadota bacterium]
MRVLKRNGEYEIADLNKIVKAINRSCQGLNSVDAVRVATRTIAGLYDGATTSELDNLSIQTAASFIAEEPEYSFLAARMLNTFIEKEVTNQNIYSFSQSVEAGHKLGIINDKLLSFVNQHSRKLNQAIKIERSNLFHYFGLRTVYDRYLLKHPTSRKVFETPQYFMLRVACAVSDEIKDALELYEMFSNLEYLTSSPTLFNAGTRHQQLSSCFLLDSPSDQLVSIYNRYTNIAMLSKFSGGIGLSYSRIRSRGSHISSTNGLSNGIVPWLKTLDASVAAVNQGGRRKGACCVYLETWHADILEFLELRDNTGDEARRTHNLNLANWVPDLFMKRIETDGIWSLFDPKKVPELVDLYGDDFEKAYCEAEKKNLYNDQIKARDLYARMMRTLAQTGNGWMTFKDHANKTSNQTGYLEKQKVGDRIDLKEKNVIHLSNLCTEILEVTNDSECAVCNLGSLNLGRCVVVDPTNSDKWHFDFDKLRKNTSIAIKQLDRVIDRNFYPIDMAKASNSKWRPIGLGMMGLQDVFFKLKLPFDSPEAQQLSSRISEEIYYSALKTSLELAKEFGAHTNFHETKAAQGILHFDYYCDKYDVKLHDSKRFDQLRTDIKKHGLRNSLMIAIAPTATIASITGCYECIEPQVSNLFKRETLSGDFLQINTYLVQDLKDRGLWTEQIRTKIKMANGSISNIEEIPSELKELYRTAWEVQMRSLIDMAALRIPFIDQSQSLNLFMESPTINKLSSMYFYAWKRGLKTTYYLRSRPATEIAKTTISYEAQTSNSGHLSAEQLACSLENPEACEACQ